jgi:hypothetical protein
MKLLAILFSAVPLFAFGGESFFFTLAGKPGGQRIEDDSLHLSVPIRKIPPPEASSIIAFHQGLGQGREFKIQINLKSSPEEKWVPMLNLDGEIIMDGISVARPGDARFTSSFSLEGDDPKKISRWVKLLGTLLKIPADKIEIDLNKARHQE